MKLRFWGTRGSVPSPRPGTERYGGNTSCVEICGDDPAHLVVLDAGTGICALGAAGLAADLARVDILLTHLHMDHILGLGFFDALFRPDLEIHIWGPASPVHGLHERLSRYLSPPLFPVRLRELPCCLTLHDVPLGSFTIPGYGVRSELVCHPGPTVGYRLDDGRNSVVYLPDHEPALGARRFPDDPEWTSGHSLAAGADFLVHDAQYDDREYEEKAGWGHSAVAHTYAFALAAGVGHLLPFHHDPRHDDPVLDRMFEGAAAVLPFHVTPAQEGLTVEVGASVAGGAAI